MTRLAFLLVVLVAAGCTAAARNAAMPDLDAAVACDGAKAIVAARKPAAPAPKPVTPPGVCERCQGTGYIGDKSAIRVVCPTCGGTGKAAAPKPACTTGRCGVPR